MSLPKFGHTLCVPGSTPEESQPQKQSLASHLSEKFQSFLSSDGDKDDDFQPDRKRIRTAELKVDTRKTSHSKLHVL